MNLNQKIERLINGRVCCVLSKGKTLEQLEENAHLFKGKDICWIIQNRYDYLEEHILRKMGRRTDMVANCATVAKKISYEIENRFPAFVTFLSRSDDNLLLTSKLVIKECFEDNNKMNTVKMYEKKIITIEDILSQPGYPKEMMNPPPNSLTLLLAFLIAGQAKKIILFGVDGNSSGNTGLGSYYMQDIAKRERRAAFGDERIGTVLGDSLVFRHQWPDIFKMYKESFKNPDVEILNCSSNSTIAHLPIIDYTNIKTILEGVKNVR